MSDSTSNLPAENALSNAARNYPLMPDWTIGEVLSEAWRLKDGFKWTYWGAVLIYAVIAVLTSEVTRFLTNESGFLGLIAQLVSLLITLPLATGLWMIAIKHSVGLPTRPSMIFDYYPKTIPIFLTYLLMVVMVAIGFVLLVIPGIYLMFAYALAMPLLVDKTLGMWEALETSRKAITPCWFRCAALFIVAFVITMVSAIPFGIGLIWTVPFCGLVMSVLYRNLVGVTMDQPH